MNKDLELITTIKTRKLQYLGHIIWHPEKYNLLQLIIQGKIIGRIGTEEDLKFLGWTTSESGSIHLRAVYSEQIEIK